MLKANWKPALAATGLTLALFVTSSTCSPGAIGLAQAQVEPTPGSAQGTGHEGHHDGEVYNVAAQAIGITPQQLRQELPGKSLAQVAEAHGKNPADVASALKAVVNQRIDQAIDRAMNRVVEADER